MHPVLRRPAQPLPPGQAAYPAPPHLSMPPGGLGNPPPPGLASGPFRAPAPASPVSMPSFQQPAGDSAPMLLQNQREVVVNSEFIGEVGTGPGGGMKQRKKIVVRKTVDYNASCIRHLTTRLCRGDHRRSRAQPRPDPSFILDMQHPQHMLDIPVSSVTSRFVHTSTNKIRCPINTICWTPDGRRLLTGNTSGEFTVWNGLTFNFETIMQAHDVAVRGMRWSHNSQWLLSSDHSGQVRYWQPNLNNVNNIAAHREAVRDITFCPTDAKFATASDDGTIKIWAFTEGLEERVLTGHGWDVKCVDWHPNQSLLVSGSKDSLIKLWDPRSARQLSTVHGHKGTVQGLSWNKNGVWFGTAGRDGMVRVYDVRAMRELAALRGHRKEACSLSWHPHNESLLVTGGSEGSMLYWLVGEKEAVHASETAHDSNVWSMAWHPTGHVLASGSNDHATRFWTRPRPGEEHKDRLAADVPASIAAATASHDMMQDDFLPGLSSTGPRGPRRPLPPPQISSDAAPGGGYAPSGRQPLPPPAFHASANISGPSSHGGYPPRDYHGGPGHQGHQRGGGPPRRDGGRGSHQQQQPRQQYPRYGGPTTEGDGW